MSEAGDMITALTTVVEDAVTGVTVLTDPINPEKVKIDDLPACLLFQIDYSVEPLEYLQEERTWTFFGELIVKGGTRETMRLALEAIRDAVFDDPTLDGSAHVATCAPLVPYTQTDSEIVYGQFSVQARITV